MSDSTKIILKIVLVVLGLGFLYVIRDVLALFFVSVLIAAAIDPAVSLLQKTKLPRSVSVLVVYVLLLIIIGTIISFLVPALIEQFNEFTKALPNYLDRLGEFLTGLRIFGEAHGLVFNQQQIFENISKNIGQSSSGIFSTTVGIFTGAISFVAILSMAFYMSVKEDGMENFLNTITPKKYQKQTIILAEKIKDKIGLWMAGQLLLAVIIFILDYLFLLFLGVPYALVLAIIGGVLEIIPYFGPIISTVIGVTIALFVSPLKGFFVLLGYIVIQQLENNILVPQIMKKAVGLNPLVVILSLLIGMKLAGTIGAVLAVPVATAIGVVAKDLLDGKLKQ